jgi:hypothetical protein
MLDASPVPLLGLPRLMESAHSPTASSTSGSESASGPVKLSPHDVEMLTDAVPPPASLNANEALSPREAQLLMLLRNIWDEKSPGADE